MSDEDKNVFVPQQFENKANPMAHRNHTAVEIIEQAECEIDGFVQALGQEVQ